MEDDFAKVHDGSKALAAYNGKHYPDNTEVLSMGLAEMYADPLKFAKADPEYSKFTAGVMNGTLLHDKK